MEDILSLFKRLGSSRKRSIKLEQVSNGNAKRIEDQAELSNGSSSSSSNCDVKQPSSGKKAKKAKNSPTERRILNKQKGRKGCKNKKCKPKNRCQTCSSSLHSVDGNRKDGSSSVASLNSENAKIFEDEDDLFAERSDAGVYMSSEGGSSSSPAASERLTRRSRNLENTSVTSPRPASVCAIGNNNVNSSASIIDGSLYHRPASAFLNPSQGTA